MNDNVNEKKSANLFLNPDDYDKYITKVLSLLKEEITSMGLEDKFEGIDLVETFIQPYLLGKMNEIGISSFLKREISQEEIDEYIAKNRTEVTDSEMLELHIRRLFSDKPLTSEEEKKLEYHNSNPKYEESMTENEARKRIQEQRQIDYQSALQSLDNLISNQRGFIMLYDNPHDFTPKIASTKGILKGEPLNGILDDGLSYDFKVNEEIITAIGLGYPEMIEVYSPIEQYPKVVTFSALLHKEKEDECAKKLEELYRSFQRQGVDVSAVFKNKMLELANKNTKEIEK